jgi:hypothetical protein
MLNLTRIIEVPFLTNSLDVEKGEELILEVFDKAIQPAKPRTWRNAFADEERSLAQDAKKPKQADQSTDAKGEAAAAKKYVQTLG